MRDCVICGAKAYFPLCDSCAAKGRALLATFLGSLSAEEKKLVEGYLNTLNVAYAG